MKNTLLIFLVLISVNIYSQQQGNTEHFTVRVREVMGDLNRDGLQDKVILTMDTVNAQQPLKLQIFLLQSNRKLRLEFSSKDVFNPQYPNGKYGGDQVPSILIENGNLILYCEIKDVKEYLFQIDLDDLPAHQDIQKLDNNSMDFLKVYRVHLTSCPSPSENIKNWITEDWIY